MVNPSSAITAPEFLQLRQNLIDRPDALDRFDEQLIDMCVRQPDEAVQILTTLTHSGDVEDRKTAAAYGWHLFTQRHDTAAELSYTLATDPDEDVRELATDGVTAAAEHAAITTVDAAKILSGR